MAKPGFATERTLKPPRQLLDQERPKRYRTSGESLRDTGNHLRSTWEAVRGKVRAGAIWVRGEGRERKSAIERGRRVSGAPARMSEISVIRIKRM